MENLLETSVEPMTKFGYERLQAEANHLKLEVRPAVIKAIEEAADMGDLKENAEYHWQRAAGQHRPPPQGDQRPAEQRADRRSEYA